MIKKMKLGAKIGSGFGINILIAAILGFVGWSGVNGVRTFMAEYASWGNIDMVMNESVSQNVLKLVNTMYVYQTTPNEKNFKTLQDALAEADGGVEEWRALVKGYPKLEEVAVSTKEKISITRQVIDQYSNVLKTTVEIKGEWDNLVNKCLSHLETTMEEMIDPAKEKAEQAENIREMVRWGNIDMVMNEGVIANVLKLQTAAHDYASKSSDEAWSKFLKALKDAKEGLSEWRGTLAGEEKMAQAAKKIEEYLTSYEKLGQNYHEEVTKMQRLQQTTDASFESLFVALENAMENVIDPAKDSKVNAASAAQKKASLLAFCFTIGGVILGILLAFFITRSITKPINRVIEGLKEGSDQIASASGQVSSASQSLAEGSAEQAASIEETSSALEEMASMTKTNANNANHANHLMTDANNVVTESNQAMGQVTASMGEISSASQETQKIIKTIDEIAFQTNLLALNAAVEAARAGEAGAGFAVVADEVRNLAIRAAEAAKNTADLIEGTVKTVTEGTDLVDKTNEAFGQVAESASKVGQLVGEITAASEEQAQGINEINKAVAEMDKVTQQNAANAEESASAAEEMSAQAEQMRSYVNELVALVDGKAGQTTMTQSRPVRKTSARVKRVARHKTKALAAPAGKEKARPEDIIPMDDDDFKDF